MIKNILNKTYEITFLMLICITIIVYIRSLNYGLDDKKILSLQLAGLVTSVAAFHYYYMINTQGSPVAYRYFDWFFTTPILLIDLCIILDIYQFNFIIKIILLNTLMLLFGYFGEIKILSMLNSTILGFIPFILIFYMIKQKIDNNEKLDQKSSNLLNINNSYLIYYIFLGLWGFYGINHLSLNLNIKNIIYNLLDLLTKGIFALYIYNQSW